MKFDFWSVVIIVFIFQGLFLLLVLLFSLKRKKKAENKYLFGLIVVLIWYLAEFLTIRNKLDIGFNIFYGTRYGSWLLLGPLTFFYFRSVTDKLWKFSKISLLHYAPFLLIVIIAPLLLNDVVSSRQVDYGMLSVFDHRAKVIKPIQYIYSVIFILQFIHLGFYIFKNLGLIKIYEAGLTLQYAQIDLKVKWLKVFNLLTLTILIFSVVFLYILLVTDIYRRSLDYIYVLPMGVLLFLLTYYLMDTSWKEVDKKITKYASSSLDIENIPLYREKLDTLMNEKKVYLENEIRLADLAEMLDLKTHHASQLINQYYNQSFFDFINNFRVKEAKEIIQNYPEYTMLQVAFQSGFNNKTSFVNAFKKFEKATPSKYREACFQS